ncbi:outer membrane protein assembly factor BamD [Sulfurospirillum arcachonense]|uniref:outer membrane protein assembly factor BamD n=1 Tax=Sulfurospirillum arcachonense TaxID=57666 RepID=UPI0004B8C6B3|nr:outer membrane protein assembly factor BamD [Sulfurospirillum arcachonense]
MKIMKIVAVAFMLVAFYGCADKSKEVYNKPALYWYGEIIKNIKDFDLEEADNLYTSLSSEHVSSPLLPEAMIILAQAHMDEEEYLLANFYLDEYIKRFGTTKKSEYARFMKIKANFESFPNPNRNQQLLLDTLKQTKEFVLKYPESKYRPMVETMYVKLKLGEHFMVKNIADLYSRIDKPEAAKIYQDQFDQSALKNAQMIKPNIPWYRAWFEE